MIEKMTIRIQQYDEPEQVLNVTVKTDDVQTHAHFSEHPEKWQRLHQAVRQALSWHPRDQEE